MPKGFISSARSYVKNVWGHTKLVATREETISAAFGDLARDVKKLKATVVDIDVEGAHGKAVQLVKAGQRKYNAQDYVTAEKCFRSATFEDPHYALAVTYLGHSLYKLGRTQEAVHAWQRAIEIDPDSYAAKRARRKLQHVQTGEAKLISELEERLGQ